MNPQFSMPKSVTIGRDADNNIIISVQNVSSHHAVFRIDNGNVTLEDLNSSNGTFVNGKKIFISKVTERDSIMFGQGNYFDWNKIRPYLESSYSNNYQQPSSNNYSPTPYNPPMDGRIYNPQPVNSQPIPLQRNANPQPNVHAGLGGELVWAMEMNKSYVGSAVITMLLYIFVIWIGGLIANIVYLNQAKRTREITGNNPPGYGCLVALIIIFGIIPAIIGFFFFSAIMSALS